MRIVIIYNLVTPFQKNSYKTMQKTLLATLIAATTLVSSQNILADGHDEKISISGVAEVLATYNDEDDKSNTDLEVDTVELTVDAQVNELISASITMAYEDDPEGEGDFYVDEAIIVIGEEDGDISLTLGKTGIPFGVINGSTWTDPLTDDFSDNTNDDLAMVAFGTDSLSAEVYVFKGDQENDNNVDNFGASISFELEDSLSLGAGFLSNIGSIEAFGQDEDASAFRLNAAYAMGNLELSAEFIQAEEFKSLNKAKPSAMHIAADFGTEIIGAPGMVAVGYSSTDDAEDLDLAESMLVVSVSRELGENAETILEYVNEEPYGNGDSVNTVNAVLSVSF